MERDVFRDMRYGEVRRVGDKLYSKCPECKQIVRVDKPIFGDLHICVLDEAKRRD
jgi:hypothetical protein